MITPLPQSILQIVGPGKRYGIPRYQRSYKWGVDEAKELVEDLSSQEGAQELFLGTMIFEETESNLSLIVDGQQRLTTIMLLTR